MTARKIRSAPVSWLRPLLVLAVLASGLVLAQREITNISGDLYRFQNNFHYSVFLVTPEGVIATDPIDAEAAAWLKAEIAERFDLPIRYLVYSHDHPDHISGGEVFAEDGTIVIAHENARRVIVEQNRATAVPDITFSDELVIELGGKRVELRYVGRNHSDNSIVMAFPDEGALFAVDFIPTGRTLPFQTLNDSYFPDWMESLDAVAAMDFEVLVPGHGALGDHSDVANMRAYLQDLYDAVAEQVAAGSTLEETIEAVKLEQYSDWGQYEAWLPLNIEGMYSRIPR